MSGFSKIIENINNIRFEPDSFMANKDIMTKDVKDILDDVLKEVTNVFEDRATVVQNVFSSNASFKDLPDDVQKIVGAFIVASGDVGFNDTTKEYLDSVNHDISNIDIVKHRA